MRRIAGQVPRPGYTSDPPRGVSIQAFGIFSKIREIDTLLIARPELRKRIFELHPEVAFARLNGETPMSLPKKIAGKVNTAGMEERKACFGPRLRTQLPGSAAAAGIEAG